MGMQRAEIWVHASTDEQPNEQQAFVFDTRPLSEQIEALCGCFGLQYNHDDEYRVLTRGPSVNTRPIRSEAEVLILPPTAQLGLHHGSDLAEARIRAVANATQGHVVAPLRELAIAIKGDVWLCGEVVEKDGLRALLESVLNIGYGDHAWVEAVELAMVCMSVLISLCPDETRDWLAEHVDDLGAPLFARLFAVLFPPLADEDLDVLQEGSSRASETTPRASLMVCLFVLQSFPDCAEAAAEAASIGASKWGQKAAGGFGPAYPRMFAAMRGEEDRNEFQMSASVALLCALVGAAADNDELRPQVRNDFANFTSHEELEELFAPDLREQHLRERHLSLAMDCCSELAVSQQEDLLKEVAQLKLRMQTQQETIERLQVELQQRHRVCCAMVPFMKVDSSLLVEQSLDSLVRFGWESISWRNNYTLLHFAADCLDDPRIIELVGSFAKDVDQRDDSGKRPIDYARKNACPEVAPTLESLRKQRRQEDASRKLAASTPEPSSAVDRDTLRDQLRSLEELPEDLRDGIDAVLRLGPQGVPWLSGYSALHLAAQLGHVEATDLLLQARADVSEVDDWQMTPLDYAEQNHHIEVIRMLQAAGVSGAPRQPAAELDSPRGSEAPRQRAQTEEALDLTESRRVLQPGLGPEDDDEEGLPRPSRRQDRVASRFSCVSRLSCISDTDLGLSSEQLADIGNAFSRSEVRHRALTAGTDIDDACSVHSSQFGLSEWQLQELEGGQAVRHRLDTAMTDASAFSAQDSEYGFSDRQMLELRRRYATSEIPGFEDHASAGSDAQPDAEDEPNRVQTSRLSAEALQQLPGAEPEVHSLTGQRLQRRLTETSEKRFSVADSEFGLSDKQLAALCGAEWAWKSESTPAENTDDDDAPRRSTEPDSAPRPADCPEAAGGEAADSESQRPERQRARPSLRKRVSFSFKAEMSEVKEHETEAPVDESDQEASSPPQSDDVRAGGQQATSAQICTEATSSAAGASAPGSHSSLAQQLEVRLAAMFKDMPDPPSSEVAAAGGACADAGTASGALSPEMEQSCRQACRLVMQHGWGKVLWDNNFTALHLAAHHKDVDAVRFLLQARASLSDGLQDSSGMSPLDYAREAGCEGELVDILQAADAHPAVSSTAAAPGSASEPQSPMAESFLSFGDALTERMVAPRTRDPATPTDAAELQARLMRVEKERAALLEERNRPLLQGGSFLAQTGHLDESTMRKLLEQLQAFGHESVLGKVQEPRMSGGLALSAADATRVVEQLEVVLRVSQALHETSNKALPLKPRRSNRRHSTWNGGENPLAGILGLANKAEEEEAQRKSIIEQVEQDQIRQSWGVAVKEAAAIASSSFIGAAPDCSRQESESEESGPEKAATACDPPPAEGEVEPRHDAAALEVHTPKGKGKAKGKGAPPKGKGKGKGKEGAPPAQKKLELSKPKLELEVKMKPLWWTRYLKGVHLKEGETVWDLVADETEMIPVDLLKERFGKAKAAAKSAAKSSSRSVEQEEQQQQPSVVRIITDPALIAGREAALKSLPPPQDVAAAIIEMDEQVLPMDKLQNVMSNACPNPLQVEQLAKAREEKPTLRFAVPEQYMWVIMNIPAHKARLDCWSFVRTYTERRLQCVEALRRFEELTDCFRRSGNLPSLLGLVLAMGNYLNGGTERGQADGFDLETLAKLDQVKDGDGRDLRHLIFETFFNKCPEKACEVVEELCPLLANVERRLVRDADGCEKLSKKVNVSIEDYDLMINSLEGELEACLSASEMILQYIDDPADRFKLRMPEQIARAKDQIGALSKQRDRAKENFGQLMHWFKVSPSSGLKSSEFCLLWDEFFIPEAMIVRRPAKVKTGHLIPNFCGQGKRITGEQLMVLWGVREPSAQKKPAPKAGLKGGLRQRKRFSLTAQTERRKSLRAQVGAVIAAQQLSRKSKREKTIREGRERFFTASADSVEEGGSPTAPDADLARVATTFC